VFIGTRVPLQNLFDDLEAGDRIDDFPAMSKEQAIAVLESARQALADGVSSSR
jgi:uncharacterized protein (DUF433 family)